MLGPTPIVRYAGSIWERPEVLPFVAVLGSLLVSLSLTSPARAAMMVIVVAPLVVTLALWLPAHLFLAASLAVLATSSLFESRAINVGSAQVYTLDMLVVVVLLRAVLSRERRDPGPPLL